MSPCGHGRSEVDPADDDVRTDRSWALCDEFGAPESVGNLGVHAPPDALRVCDENEVGDGHGSEREDVLERVDSHRGRRRKVELERAVDHMHALRDSDDDMERSVDVRPTFDPSGQREGATLGGSSVRFPGYPQRASAVAQSGFRGCGGERWCHAWTHRCPLSGGPGIGVPKQPNAARERQQ